MGDSKEEMQKQREREAYEAMTRRLGHVPEVRPGFSLMETLQDFFLDKRTRTTDWGRVAMVGLGGVLGLGSGSGFGWLGMGAMGLAGAGLIGFGGSYILDALRGESKKPALRPPPVHDPNAPDGDTSVVGGRRVTLPEIPGKVGAEIVEIPVYDAARNRVARANLAELENWRRAMGESVTLPFASVGGDATNRRSRQFYEMLKKEANTDEINLRTVADLYRERLPAAVRQAQAYLERLSPEAARAANLSLDVSDVPGRFGALPDNLEEYGRLIKEDLLKEYAALRGQNVSALDLESHRNLVERSWGQLNVIAKRTLIRNFAEDAVELSRGMQADYRDFFPDREIRVGRLANSAINRVTGVFGMSEKEIIPPVGYHVSTPATWVGDATGWTQKGAFIESRKRFVEASNRGNRAVMVKEMNAMASILEQRLAEDGKLTGLYRLTEDAKRKMRTYIMGARAFTKLETLDRYIQDTVIGKEIPRLDRFRQQLLEHNHGVAEFEERMQGLQATGLLLVVEGAVENDKQRFTLRDFRSPDGGGRDLVLDVSYKPGTRQAESYTLTAGGNAPKTVRAAASGELPAAQAAKLARLREIIHNIETGAPGASALLPGVEKPRSAPLEILNVSPDDALSPAPAPVMAAAPRPQQDKSL